MRVLIFAALSLPLFARGQDLQTCESALSLSSRRYNGVLFEATRVIPGRFGGARVFYVQRDVLRRSRYGTVVYVRLNTSLERGPGGITLVLGEGVVARFLGFESVRDGNGKLVEASMPDGAELNGAIRAINAKIGDPGFLPISYISVGTKIADRNFLRLYAYENKLPAAVKGHYFIHDISAHGLFNLLPDSVIRLSQRQVRLVLEFEQYVAAHHQNIYDEAWFAQVMKRLAEDIDFGSGNFVLGLEDGRRARSLREAMKLPESIDQMIRGGQSPVARLQRIVASAKNREMRSALEKFLALPENTGLELHRGIEKDWIYGGTESSAGKPLRASAINAIEDKIRRLGRVVESIEEEDTSRAEP